MPAPLPGLKIAFFVALRFGRPAVAGCGGVGRPAPNFGAEECFKRILLS
jgi:hypothetical protein